MYRHVYCVFFLLLLAGNATAAGLNASLIAGDYTPLLLGIDPQSKTITGYYEDATGGGRFQCLFFLYGKMDGEPPYRIQTWFPKTDHKADIISGHLWPDTRQTSVKRQADGQPPIVNHLDTAVRIQLDEEPGGCGNVSPWLVQEHGDALPLEKAADWRAVRMISARKALLHNAPAADKQRKGYLVRGNIVRVIDATPGWISIVYHANNGRDIRGWIKTTDLFSEQPPAQ